MVPPLIAQLDTLYIKSIIYNMKKIEQKNMVIQFSICISDKNPSNLGQKFQYFHFMTFFFLPCFTQTLDD